MGCGSSKTVEVNEKSASGNDSPKITPEKTSSEKIQDVVNKKPAFKPEDRVHVKGYTGTVKFVGSTNLGDGEWVGIELDKQHPQGNDGFFEKTTYFACKPKHGLFARPEVVFHYSDMDVITETSEIPPSTIIFIQTRIKRLLAKIRLRKLQERSGTEKKVDYHVRNTPPEATASVNQLSHYLTEPFESTREKAFAIYRWLTFHIEYDVAGFFGRSEKKGTSAQAVLQHRSSVCAGYANLYTALGKAAGLEIHTVEGYAKGYGHKPGQQFTGTNHAWNALNIDNTWYLSDATWGAGYVGKDMLFERVPNTFRFLMVPEDAIYDHLPEHEKWQFLDPPIDKETYQRAAKPSGAFHEMGIEMESHKESHYEVAGDSIEMTFYCPGKKMILMGKVKNSSGQTLEGRDRVLLRFSGLYQVQMRAQFPEPGKYTVELYVAGAVENNWEFGVDYDVTAKQGCGWDNGGFPRIAVAMDDHGFQLVRPLENIETSDGRAEIVLQCLSTKFSHLKGRVQTVNGKDLDLKGNPVLCFSEETKMGFTLKVHVPVPGTHKLDMWASAREKGLPSIFLCTYFINSVNSSTNKLPDVAGFPQLSERCYEWGVKLLEPKQNINSLDGKVAISLKIPEGVENIKGYLKHSEESLHGYCLTTEENDATHVLVHFPDKGFYKLNIFGQKGPKGKHEYLLSYVINAAKGAGKNAGFPNCSDAFASMELKLLNNENITTSDDSVSLKLQNPKGVKISAHLKDRHENLVATGVCVNVEGNVEVTCDIPAPRLYKLNLFGKEEDGTKNVWLCTYNILRQ